MCNPTHIQAAVGQPLIVANFWCDTLQQATVTCSWVGDSHMAGKWRAELSEQVQSVEFLNPYSLRTVNQTLYSVVACKMGETGYISVASGTESRH
jgi:hypothetical protein